MFNDIGALELVALVILAVFIFGPDKLPKVIHETTQFIRKVRAFSENAKADIRSELGPEFKDFEFEDLNPKTFVRKQLMENDDLKELRSSFDLRKEMNEIAGSVTGAASEDDSTGGGSSGGSKLSLSKSAGAGPADSNGSDLLRKGDERESRELPPFDADAT
ncbi:sec-independent translocase [Streptomyces sp. TP-A0874]|uniref:sec-independent translocase n=1 Tax=Streptomyces sp. TP-A0874 TaxID=549819 RepID=UPI000852A6D1|nr:sec-independent translocase [Streptomyces sp. TP-A0874]